MATITASIDGIEEILRAFQGLSVGVQRKYLGASVRAVVKSAVPEIKAITPKGPTGNLRRSVGMKLEKKKKSTTALGLVGYRRGGEKANEKGFHAYWAEEGTKDRYPKSRALRLPLKYAGKYPYIKNLINVPGGVGPTQNLAMETWAAFVPSVRGYVGSGKFQQWADMNLPDMEEDLIEKLEEGLDKALDEQRRRLARRAAGKK